VNTIDATADGATWCSSPVKGSITPIRVLPHR
jgi:hypothetical protein